MMTAKQYGFIYKDYVLRNYYDTGLIKSMVYFKRTGLLDGFVHREDGPARINYTNTGGIKSEHYYLNGIHYSKREYNKQLKADIYKFKAGMKLYNPLDKTTLVVTDTCSVTGSEWVGLLPVKGKPCSYVDIEDIMACMKFGVLEHIK